jgi:hypothetical protein
MPRRRASAGSGLGEKLIGPDLVAPQPGAEAREKFQFRKKIHILRSKHLNGYSAKNQKANAKITNKMSRHQPITPRGREAYKDHRK